MRMSDGVEWALHVSAVLVAVPPDKGLTAAKLAEFHGVPGAYLAKHLQALTRAGVFEAVPGRFAEAGAGQGEETGDQFRVP